jgi:hypothetical protein
LAAGALLPLGGLIGSHEDTPLRRAALNLNLPFARGISRISPCRTELLIAIRSLSAEYSIPMQWRAMSWNWVAEGMEIARWFLANVQVPKGTPTKPGVQEQIAGRDRSRAHKASPSVRRRQNNRILQPYFL